MLHQVAVVDADEHVLEGYYNVDTPLNEFLVEKICARLNSKKKILLIVLNQVAINDVHGSHGLLVEYRKIKINIY